MSPISSKEKRPEEEKTKKEGVLSRFWSNSYKKDVESPEKSSPKEELPVEETLTEETPPLAEDALSQLWGHWCTQRGLQGSNLFAPYELVNGKDENDEEKQPAQENADLQAFYEELQQGARDIMAREQAGPQPVDAEIRIHTSRDRMRAWIFLFPPQMGGAEVSADGIRSALLKAGIYYGIKPERVDEAAEQQLYFKLIPIARGQDAVQGKNGEIIDCIPRDTKIETKEHEDGSVDYRNVNAFHNISKGTVVCKIIPPEEGIDGINVRGEKVCAKHGKPADIPRSANVVLSQSGTELIAAIDGHVTFDNNKFIVEKLLVIDGDVDISVGNLTFDGDIVISGDVRDSFEVKATGNVTVRGMVEDASISAGGDIILEKGMNGNTQGKLDAHGEIRSKFLENCNVRATGNVFAGSIIWSNICCDAGVYVLSEKGVIIGGTCTVCKEIQARGIGSKSNRMTTVVLGSTPHMLEKKQKLEDELESIRSQYHEVVKDATYLESRPGPISEERKNLLNRLRLSKPVLLMKESRLVKKLEKLGEEMEDVSKGRILCDTIYPFSKVVIGDASLMVESIFHCCLIHYREGEVVIDVQ